MDTLEWLEGVASRLRSSGTPVAYQQRLLDELRDHVEDLHCEERNHAMSAEAVGKSLLNERLGTPEDIAASAKVNAGRARFACRHPVVTYLLAPIPALLLLWTAYALGLAGILQLFQSYKNTDWAVNLAGILIHGLAYIPAIFLTLLIAWVAVRSQTRVAWWLVASTMIASVSGLMMVSYRMPTLPGTGTLNVGVGFPPDLARWPQFLVPLGAAVALVCYSVFKQRSDPFPAAASDRK